MDRAGLARPVRRVQRALKCIAATLSAGPTKGLNFGGALRGRLMLDGADPACFRQRVPAYFLLRAYEQVGETAQRDLAGDDDQWVCFP
jgi:hypothetical protein